MTATLPRVSVLQDSGTELDLSALAGLATLRLHDASDPADVDDRAEILFVTETLPESWRRIIAQGAVRWIHYAGIGVDQLLSPELAKSDVVVTNSRGVLDTAISEYVLGLVLALAKDLPRTIRDQLTGTWDHRPGLVLRDMHAVLVGAGSIGRATARLLMSVGMQVSVVGRHQRDGDGDFGRVHGVDELRGLAARSDVLVVAAPLTPETRHLIGTDVLELVKPGAFLINVGRGEVVDESALLMALDSGRLAGAGLDVFAAEPLGPGHRFWSMEQVIVSPHMSGETERSWEDSLEVFATNLRSFIRGEPLHGVVDKSRGYVPTPRGSDDAR